MLLKRSSSFWQSRRLQFEGERGGHRAHVSLLQSFVGMAIVVAVACDLSGFLGMLELCVASNHLLKRAAGKLSAEIIMEVAYWTVSQRCELCSDGLPEICVIIFPNR